MNISLNNAKRLIRTEISAMHNKAELDALKILGVEFYEIVAVLDRRTSEICMEMDGKHFPVKEAVQGINAPPFHANCRTLVEAYYDDFRSEDDRRTYRDDDGKSQTTRKPTAKEWKKEQARKAQTAKNTPYVGRKDAKLSEKIEDKSIEKSDKKGDKSNKNGYNINNKIPTVSASINITQKIKNGEISKELNKDHHNKHIEGHKQYDQYLKDRLKRGLGPQGILTISPEEHQQIIDQFSGKGIVRVDRSGKARTQEDVNVGRVVGKCCVKGVYYETTKVRIYYGKNGAHIVPIKGDHFD